MEGPGDDLWGSPVPDEPGEELWETEPLSSEEPYGPDDGRPDPPGLIARVRGGRRDASAGIDRLRSALGRIERAARDAAFYAEDLASDARDDASFWGDPDRIRLTLLDLTDVLERDVGASIARVRSELRKGRTRRVLPALRLAERGARDAVYFAEEALDDLRASAPEGDPGEAFGSFVGAVEDMRTVLEEDVSRRLRSVRRFLEGREPH